MTLNFDDCIWNAQRVSRRRCGRCDAERSGEAHPSKNLFAQGSASQCGAPSGSSSKATVATVMIFARQVAVRNRHTVVRHRQTESLKRKNHGIDENADMVRVVDQAVLRSMFHRQFHFGDVICQTAREIRSPPPGVVAVSSQSIEVTIRYCPLRGAVARRNFRMRIREPADGDHGSAVFRPELKLTTLAV